MNLGGMEAIAKEVAGKAILDHAVETERKLDEKLAKLDTIDEDELEKIRQRRRAQLVEAQRAKQENLANGHGRYTELADQPAFFEATKKSKWMAVHFYRPTTQRCQIVDAHLERIAQKHVETRFCKINAEKSPYLTEKLNILVMPTVLLIDGGKTVHQIRGFDELGATDDFHEDTLAYVMSTYGVLNFEGEPPSDPTKAAGVGVNSIALRVLGKGAARASAREGDGDGDY
ncbi:unnamed protein product [Ascophyllum nodosum]